MLELLKDHVGDAAAPFIFLILFLVVVGGALWLTSRIAKWLDEKDKKHPGYYDGMLTEDPNKKSSEDEKDPDK